MGYGPITFVYFLWYAVRVLFMIIPQKGNNSVVLLSMSGDSQSDPSAIEKNTHHNARELDINHGWGQISCNQFQNKLSA